MHQQFQIFHKVRLASERQEYFPKHLSAFASTLCMCGANVSSKSFSKIFPSSAHRLNEAWKHSKLEFESFYNLLLFLKRLVFTTSAQLTATTSKQWNTRFLRPSNVSKKVQSSFTSSPKRVVATRPPKMTTKNICTTHRCLIQSMVHQNQYLLVTPKHLRTPSSNSPSKMHALLQSRLQCLVQLVSFSFKNIFQIVSSMSVSPSNTQLLQQLAWPWVACARSLRCTQHF